MTHRLCLSFLPLFCAYARSPAQSRRTDPPTWSARVPLASVCLQRRSVGTEHMISFEHELSNGIQSCTSHTQNAKPAFRTHLIVILRLHTVLQIDVDLSGRYSVTLRVRGEADVVDIVLVRRDGDLALIDVLAQQRTVALRVGDLEIGTLTETVGQLVLAGTDHALSHLLLQTSLGAALQEEPNRLRRAAQGENQEELQADQLKQVAAVERD